MNLSLLTRPLSHLLTCLLLVCLAVDAGAVTTNKISATGPLTNTTALVDQLILQKNNGSSFTTSRQTVGQFLSNAIPLLSLVNSNSQTAAINTASNALAALIGSGGGGDVTTAQLNTASNALVAISRTQDTTTSNALVDLSYTIGAAATNYTLSTSNYLLTLAYASDAAGSNALRALAYTIGTQSTNYTLGASNSLHALWLSGSNVLAGLLAGGGSGDVTTAQLNAASNVLVSLSYLIGTQSTNYTLGASNSLHALWLSGSNVLAGLVGGGVATNVNQFAPNPVLTIKPGALFTNAALDRATNFVHGMSLANRYTYWESNQFGVGKWAYLLPSTNESLVFYSLGSTNSPWRQAYIGGDLFVGDFVNGGTGSGGNIRANQMWPNNLYATTGYFTNFYLKSTTSAGYVLTSDAFGQGTWQAASGGSQTPWTATINGAGYGATNIGSLQVNGAINSASLNITTLSQGFTSLTVASATAVTVDLGQKYEIHATNNLVFTNWTGLSSTNANDSQIWVYCKTNITITWPAFRTPVLGAYFGTNANAPMWTSGTNGDWLVISASAMRTNVALTITKF